MTKSRIAFLGTGIMGLPMCRNLLQAGYAVTVWNRTQSKAAPLEADGADLVETARQAVDGADVVIIMLSSGPVVSEVLFDGVADNIAAGSVVIAMSSIPVETSREHAVHLKGQGVHYIDAPVSGGEKGAIEATLTIMAGGDAAIIAKNAALFSVLGRVTRVGPTGCGQLAKLANQTIVGITIDAVSEALLLAEAGGADLHALLEALSGGFADSTILRQHGERMVQGNFVPGAKAEVQLKDLKTSRQLAESLGLNLPVLSLTESLYREMCEAGHNDLDHSGLFVYLREKSRQSR